MASSATAICNYALARIGIGQQITNIDPTIDTSVAAAQCALWYPQCLAELQRNWTWPFTRKSLLLTQVAGPEINQQPYDFTWIRAYRYPTDALFVRRLFFNYYLPVTEAVPSPPLTPVTTCYPTQGPLTTHRQDGNPYPAPYALGADAIGTLILTDLFQASCEYSALITDTQQFSADFVSLLSWRLAMDLCLPLSRSLDYRKIAEKGYADQEMRVRANALNEGQSDAPWMTYQAEAVRGRFQAGA